MTTAPRPVHLADVLEAMADAVPDRLAIVTMDRNYTFAEIDERSTRLANHLVSLGVGPGDHVAVHSANRIEWVDAFYGCLKARAVPININYKYLHDELAYLYDNADCVATVVAPEHLAAVRALDLSALQHVLVLGEEYDAALAAASTERLAGRSADDHYVLYTGGTTGNPKGVVWRNEDIIRAALNAGRFGAPFDSVEELAAEAAANEAPMVLLACGPMMHGGSQWILGNGHVSGATVAMYTEPNFHAERILDLVATAGVHSLTFLGDAMGRPVAEAILAEPDRWDLSSLAAVSNGAAPLSEGVREEIRKALPGRFILDSYGSSESGATASRIDDGTEGPAGRPSSLQATTWRCSTPRCGLALRVSTGCSAGPGRSRWATTRTREDGRDVQGGRRDPLGDPRRLRPPRGGRQRDRPRPRLGVHQHRRGEGAPRGGRGRPAPPR